MDAATLNKRFGSKSDVSFVEGPGGLILARIQNSHGVTETALHGGQVISYQPAGKEEVFFVSRQAVYKAGKAIRGGVPICWPWFAAHPKDETKKFHGFARIMMWEVLAVDGNTLTLGLESSEETKVHWDRDFSIELRVTLSEKLRIDLVCRNPGREAYLFGGALHSYFLVSDVSGVSVEGLDGCTYVDQLDSAQCKVQKGDITIGEEVDRIYFGTTADCLICDPGMNRTIRIAKEGSRSTVVWNPWVEKSKGMSDFADDEYKKMLCVETTCANPVADWVKVEPGEEHHLVAEISIE